MGGIGKIRRGGRNWYGKEGVGENRKKGGGRKRKGREGPKI